MRGFFPFVFFLACFEKPYVLEGFSTFIRPPFLQFIDNWRTISRNKRSRLRHTQESLLLLSVADKDKNYLICSHLSGRRVPFWGCQYSIDRRSVHDKPALLDKKVWVYLKLFRKLVFWLRTNATESYSQQSAGTRPYKRIIDGLSETM